MQTVDAKSRFMSYISIDQQSGCWNWGAGLGRGGYGKFYLQGRTISAHRASWILHRGSIPNGICICHRCDNRLCVNPDHLFLGTYLDNVRDCQQKGRRHRQSGETGHSAKLTNSDAREIRMAYARNGIRLHHLAEKYGVSGATISRIVNKVTFTET